MGTSETGALALSGAELYYEIRGAGPTLLIVPSGNGDAAPFTPLAETLADRYTVITYDRRGFSRSPVHGPVHDEHRLKTDAQDIVELLTHLGQRPARVFGSSSGAIIALALLELYPRAVHTLIAHEPPLSSVLPDAQRWAAFHDELYEIFRARGVDEAKRVFRAAMGMDEATRPPKRTQPPPRELSRMLDRIQRNHAFWFEHELRTYPAFEPNLTLLREHRDRLVLAGSRTGARQFPYLPNQELSRRVGIGIRHLPGGHVGYVTHPAEFSEELAEVLLEKETDSETSPAEPG
ncbi:Pimeloyl-ACP methyl ester carboxylesterase [Actinopolyspora mzabensis]|uniref:Pimeloyl-ACP methyl ester carboxylesterase n=1 Tax=Actinopolyspora mzabensis TaxID=995066 RepID=A0A1G8Y3S7_ACTMZ|nr:alpha/beta hydrolase [Actinopolyspora mzabensis]SDJ97466.1 Pimeloyl-ACP methyl ester carboxylesterase [Actinopolyspora mzabensis]